MANNKIITTTPTLTTSSNNSNDESGLYVSTDTNTGEPTYYFRGNVENNYVSFAGFTWRIVRVNEDGTVRIIMQDGINDMAYYEFDLSTSIYYTNNSNAKKQIDTWYQTNIGNKSDLTKNIVSGNYYCEEAKTKLDSSWTSGNATMNVYTNYIPDFKCKTDGNNKGIVNGNIGLITYDELIYAGAYRGIVNNDCYLVNGNYFWTMSPGGYSSSLSNAWLVMPTGSVGSDHIYHQLCLRPVINLKADVQISSGDGTKNNPYILS